MRHIDSSNLQQNVNILFYFNTRADDFDVVEGRVFERVDFEARWKPIVKLKTYYRKRRASVENRIANQ